MEDIKIPESYYCPITHELMQDPVIDHEGNTYERKAIETWIEKNPTSPFTKNPLTLADLHPNRALRDSIDLVRQTADAKLITVSKPKDSQKRKKKVVLAVSTDNTSKPVPPPLSSVPNYVETPGGVKLTAEIGPDGLLLISAAPPMDGDRIPCDICCVIDVSGSMGDEATLKSTTGDTESHGLSILDVVKHAVRTIVEALGPKDQLSIVTFSDTATVALPLTAMKKDGKAIADCTLEGLHPTNSTNIWAGLNSGLDVLKDNKKANENRLAALYIFTDGVPNIHPPRGEEAMLQTYKTKHGLPCSVSTFGFGYSLNSVLLNNLAVEGNGVYAFIPDSSLTGTVFLNALSNTLSTFATDLVITLSTKSVEKIYGDFPIKDGTEIYMGSLKYGQRKDVVIKLNKKHPKSISLKYNLPHATKEEKCTLLQFTPTDQNEAMVHLYRLRLTEIFKSPDKPPTMVEVKKFIEEIEKSPVAKDPFVLDLVKDISGQIMEGLEEKAYQRWGRHFIPSLCRAHLLQQCNNFKDPGVQHYGGKLFRSIRETAEELFVKLPPPKPSIHKVKSTYSYSSSSSTGGSSKSVPAPAPAPVSMDYYYNCGGGCIGSEGKVLMPDNSFRLVKDIRKGDYVKLPNGESAQVICVTKTTLNPRDKVPLVLLESSLVITPWHPVLMKNKWSFPCQIGQPWNMAITTDVFNFVLEKGHIMTVNGIDCVTLGHGFIDDVVKHAYFGTEEVINDLKSLPGWQTGYIDLDSISTRRDQETGLVTGYLIN